MIGVLGGRERSEDAFIKGMEVKKSLLGSGWLGLRLF